MRYVKYTPPDRATLPSLFSPAQQFHHRMLSAQQTHATNCLQYPTAAASARSCPQPIAAQSRATPRFHCRRKCGRVCCQKSASCARNESVTTHAGCVELTCTYISSPVNHSKFTTPEPPRTYKSVSLLVSDIPLMAVPKVLMLRQQVEVRCCHAANTHTQLPSYSVVIGIAACVNAIQARSTPTATTPAFPMPEQVPPRIVLEHGSELSDPRFRVK